MTGSEGYIARHRAPTQPLPIRRAATVIASAGTLAFEGAPARLPTWRAVAAVAAVGLLAVGGASWGLIACDGPTGPNQPAPALATVCDGPGNGPERCREPRSLGEAIGVYGTPR